ncbi:RNA-directed DNA polymerase, eukaryota [Tanacetum coccineum]
MACPLPHTFDEIQALVTKFIDEDIIRQKALMELAVQFENASAAKSDFRKAYEKCYDITHESRALIDTFLKQESNKDYDMNLALYRKAAKIENQIESKFVNLVQRFLSRDKSLWFRTILAIHGPYGQGLAAAHPSNWSTIIKEVDVLKAQGIDLISHCKNRIGNGRSTSFWKDLWIGDCRLCDNGGIESTQLSDIMSILGSVILSSNEDRYFWDLNGDGDFRVKDVRNLIDETFLPKDVSPTRWVKSIPIKVNIFAWKVSLDRLPTRFNLVSRGVPVPSLSCPSCNIVQEDLGHTLFSCDLAIGVSRLVCRWWNLTWTPLDSYASWLNWFKSLRMSSSSKGVLEGVFYTAWWSIWNFRNLLLFASNKPRKEVLFDDIVTCSFTWCSARRKSTFSWASWLQHPYLLFL